MRSLAIFVTGAPGPAVLPRIGSFAALVRQTVGEAWRGGWLEIDCTASAPPDLGSLSGIVVTGSPASVTDGAAWMQRAAEALRRAVGRELPVLGICFGHQLLAHALGGKVLQNPRGREIGTVPLEILGGDPLLGQARTILVQATHVDSVVELPPEAVVVGRSRLEPCAAVRFAPEAWGVQFHPEFSADVIRLYLEERRDRLWEEGLDPGDLAGRVEDTPESAEILRRFARFVARSGDA